MASRLHPLSVPVRGGGRAIGFAVLGWVLGSMAGESLGVAGVLPAWIPYGPLAAGIAVLVALGYELLRYRRYAYDLTETSLDIESGVLFRRQREIPIRRVQNVDIERSLLQRILGIASVGIETAGGTSTEASLEYVSDVEASRLQEGIRTRKREVATDPDDREGTDIGEEASLVFELDDESLVLYSVLSLDPRVLSVFFVVVPTVGPFVSGSVEAVSITALLVIGTGVLLLAVLGAWVLSGFSRFVNFYGFRLTRIGEELRYERGLLQRYDGSVPEEKIQTLVVEENLLMRLFGYASLSIETAGYGPEAAAQSATAVPLARRERLLELARDLEPFGELRFERPAGVAKRRYLFRYGIAVTALLLVGLAVSRFVRPVPWFAVAALYAAVPLAARKQWEHRGWALPEGYVATRAGFWRRRTHVVPNDRVQTVIDRRTLFQRRWGLGTVHVDTASSGGFVAAEARAIDVDGEQAASLQRAVTDRLVAALGLRDRERE